MNKGITFLGTAGDVAVYGRQTRASGGIVVKTDETQVHLNPGPGALVQYRQHSGNPRETTAILTSSQTVLDANDVNALIEALTLDGLDKTGILLTYSSESDLVTDYHKTLVERYVQLDKGSRIAINDVEVKPTFATNQEACGFLMYLPDYVLGYIGNTGYREILSREFKDVNILIISCKHPLGVEEQHTLTVEDVKKIVKESKPNLAIITNFGEKLLAGDVIDEARNIQKATGVQTIAATDGLHINPTTYSKGFRQQRLPTA